MRHGQVADGHTNRYHGHNDIGLSPTGERQFRGTGRRKASGGRRLWELHGSDLSRSFKRAPRSSAGAGGLAPQVIPEFREVNFGAWEGLTFAEIMEQYPSQLEARLRDLSSFRIPGGESLKDVEARALPRLRELLARHLEAAFLIVAHAGVNRVILSGAMGLPLNHLFRLEQNYGCLNIIDYYPDLAVVRLLNGGVNGAAVRRQ